MSATKVVPKTMAYDDDTDSDHMEGIEMGSEHEEEDGHWHKKSHEIEAITEAKRLAHVQKEEKKKKKKKKDKKEKVSSNKKRHPRSVSVHPAMLCLILIFFCQEKEDDGGDSWDDDWGEDTSEDAVKQREKALGAASAEKVRIH